MSSFWLPRYFGGFFAALVLSWLFTWAAIHLCNRFNILDHPNERKIHSHPIPRMGGIAIFLGFLLTLVGAKLFSGSGLAIGEGQVVGTAGILLGAAVALTVGALDDLYTVSAVIKLIALFLLTLLLSHIGVITNLPFPKPVNIIITMLWITGVTSAVNALDHMDGLAGGVSAIAGLMYFLVSLQTGQFVWGLMSVCLIGSLMGYLCFNRHPARIFMGDSGSFFLGFTLAAIGMMGGWSENPVKAAIVPIMILSVPLVDLAFVIISRRLNGTTKTIKDAIVYCGKDHIGHRLHFMGFSIIATVRLVYLLAMSVSFGAFALRHANTIEAALVFVQLVSLYALIMILMHRRQQDPATAEQG